MPIVAMPDNTQVSFPDDMPPEQIKGLIASKFPQLAQPKEQPQEKGYLTRVGEAMSKNANEGANLITNASDNPLINALRVGSKAANIVSAPVAEAGVSAFRSLPQSVQDFTGNVAQGAVGSVNQGTQYIADKFNKTLLKQSIDKLSSDYPKLSATAREAGNQAIRGVTSAANIGLTIAGGKTAQPTIEKVAEGVNKLETASQALPSLLGDVKTGTPIKAKPVYNPIDIHTSIGNQYDVAKQLSSQSYNFLEKLGEGKVLPASDLVNPLKSMIDDISATPLHEGTPALPKLRDALEKLQSSSEIPLNDLVSLKQDINTYFNQKRFTQGSKTPYTQFGSKVDNLLKKAGNEYPEFGWAKTIADEQWLNTVEKPYQNNPVLAKFWKPEDYYNIKAFNEGKLQYLPEETAQRANKLIDKISSAEELQALSRGLPEEQSKKLYEEVIKNLKSRGRVRELSNVLRNAPNFTPSGIARNLRGIANVIKPEIDNNVSSILKTAKQAPEQINNNYPAMMEEIKKSVGEKNAARAAEQAAKNKISGYLPAPTLEVSPSGFTATSAERDILGRTPYRRPTENLKDLEKMSPEEANSAFIAYINKGKPNLQTPEGRAAQEQFNKAQNDKLWGKVSNDQRKIIEEQQNKAWEQYQSDTLNVKQLVLEGEQKAKDLAAAKGEKYKRGEVGNALMEALFKEPRKPLRIDINAKELSRQKKLAEEMMKGK